MTSPGSWWVPKCSSRQSPLRARRTSRLKIIALSSDALERAEHVEHAVSLERLLTTEVGRALGHDRLDATWLADQLRIARHQHRRRATDVRRRHAGAIEVAPGVAR